MPSIFLKNNTNKFLRLFFQKKIKKIKIFSAAAICTNRTMMIWAQVENVKKDWVV